MTLTKKEACKLLGISPRTLDRRMAKGQYKFTRSGVGQFAELSFTHADIGLPEPAPVVELVPAVTVEPEPQFAPSPLSESELRAEADQRFADDFKRGKATDSLGNKIDGTNEKWPLKGAQSLVGIRDDYDPSDLGLGPVNHQAHMDQRLIGTNDSLGNPVANDGWKMGDPKPDHTTGRTRSGQTLAPGITQEAYNIAMKDWRRSHGGPSMSESREAQERSKANIAASFNFARRGR